jgi:hypothetical protein
MNPPKGWGIVTPTREEKGPNEFRGGLTKNLKSEIRNIRLDKAFVRFDISDFGFEILLPKSGYFGFATK